MRKPRTKKAAREAGYASEQELAFGKMIARRHAKPATIEGEKFYSRDQCETLLSRTDARRCGLTVPKYIQPARIITINLGYGRGKCEYEAFRESDCVPHAKRREIPAREVDLLAALFAVNKSAKRYRDAAQKLYQCDSHTWAGDAREKKEELYDLKDRGIVAAAKQGRLQFAGMHGRLAVWRGEGYCFHSTLVPQDTGASPQLTDDDEHTFQDAAPREAKEARLKDAMFTLESLPAAADSDFTRLPPPSMSSRRKIRRESASEEDEDDDSPDVLPFRACG